MTAKEFLSRYGQLEVRVKAKQEKISELRAMACGISVPSGDMVQNGRDIEKTAKTIDYYISLENSLALQIQKLNSALNQIQNEIDKLQDPMQKAVLEMRYINGYSFPKIAKSCSFSERQIIRVHGKALEKINMSLNVTS